MIHPLIFFHAMNARLSVGLHDLSTYHLIFAAGLCKVKMNASSPSQRGKDIRVRYCLHLLSLFNKRSLLELVRFAFRPRKDTPNPIPVHSSAFAGLPLWLCIFKTRIVENKGRLQSDKGALLEFMFLWFSSTKCQYRITYLFSFLLILKGILIKLVLSAI